MTSDRQALKRDLLAHLDVLRDRYASYHNHKELTAWGAVALAVTFGGVLVAGRGDIAAHSLWAVLVATAFALIVIIVIDQFVREQHILQQAGYLIEAGCDRLVSRILAGDEVSADDCRPAGSSVPDLAPARNSFRFPICLLRDIREVEAAIAREPQAGLRGHAFLWARTLVWLSWVAAVGSFWIAKPDSAHLSASACPSTVQMSSETASPPAPATNSAAQPRPR